MTMALLSRTALAARAASRLPSGQQPAAFSTLADRFYNEEQKKLKETTIKLMEAEVNPYADQVLAQFVLGCFQIV